MDDSTHDPVDGDDSARRPRRSRFTRRGFLRTVTAGTALATAGVGTYAATAETVHSADAASAGDGAARTATFRWLGTSGWRVDVGERTLLVDPFVSRFSTGLFDGTFDPDTELTVDEDALAAHAGSPETILVTHSHWDHFNDVPHLAHTTGARVLGTLTTHHLALAYDVDPAQAVPVRGGEVLDFGDYVVEVVDSLHSRNASYSMAFPGVRLSRPKRPRTIADLPEGDTLAFQVTVAGGGPSVFFMGASDFAERNLRGLRPDVAMVALPSSDVTPDYVPRLLRALDHPATVVPVHWDTFEAPLTNPPPATDDARRRLDDLLADVARVSPDTTVVVPEYLTPYSFA
ncbi:MBL fold metallo-hydrolase [Streptomyces sp. 4N509B]|uniref:MBL fold metallo-hydrolase n=1 Tax=Streptomyces sp. 4N509B TaxID=3457413 RepID=UPI003FD20455